MVEDPSDRRRARSRLAALLLLAAAGAPAPAQADPSAEPRAIMVRTIALHAANMP